MFVDLRIVLPRHAGYVGLMRQVASDTLERLSVPPDAIADVELAASEACANAVRHATGTDAYRVRMHVGVDGCLLEVVDVGPGFEPRAAPAGIPDPTAEWGRGLDVIRTLVDEFSYSRVAGRTQLLLTKRWPPVAAPAAGRLASG